MKVAVWYDPRYGPAYVFMLPRRGIPDVAKIPQDVPPGPRREFYAKGAKLTWEQQAEHLTERLPVAGKWAVEEVPDGITVQQALYHVRQEATMRGLDSSQHTDVQ